MKLVEFSFDRHMGSWLAGSQASGSAEPGADQAKPTDELMPRYLRVAHCLRLLECIWPEPATAPRPPEDGFLSSAGPHCLGRFEIVRPLGRGGCGIVFLAWDPVLKREVALKVPRLAGMVSPEARQRFLREAQLAAHLSHPNLVPIHDAGQEGEVCWIASAYCQGPDLAAWLRARKEPVPVRLAAEFAATLAEAVHYIHAQGILHRDLKPSNVLLQSSATDNTSELMPKITDFGLAKHLGSYAGETPSGAILGTPLYMAPEQAEGRTSAIGPQTDVYALGAILYELLTGQPPYRGASDLDTLRQLLTRDPVPPRRLRPELPRDLEMICLRCLDPEPRRRYGSAAALADDLKRFLAGEPVLARSTSPVMRLGKWCRRRPVLAGLVGTLGLVIALGFTAVAWQWQRAEKQQRRADFNFRQSRQAVDEYFNVLSNSQEFQDLALQPARKELLLITLNYYRDFLRQGSDDPALEAKLAEACYRVAFLTDMMGNKSVALDGYGEALIWWEKLRRKDPLVLEHSYFLAKTHKNIGLIHSQFDRAREAASSLENARAIQEELTRQRPYEPAWQGDLAETYCQLGELRRKDRRDPEALQSFTKTLRIGEQLVGLQPENLKWHRLLARAHYHIGTIQCRAQDWAAASQSLGTARDLQETVVQKGLRREGSKDLSGTHRILAEVEAKQGRHDRALKHQKESLSLCEGLVREYPHVTAYRRDLAHSLVQMARSYRALGEDTDALASFNQAAPIYEKLLAENPGVVDLQRLLARTYTEIAANHQKRSRLEEALQYYERALPIWTELVRRLSSDDNSQSQLDKVRAEISQLGKRLNGLRKPAS